MLRVILAPNPSPMTLDGTRTFIVGLENPVVIDPGPNVPTHLAAILEALAGHPPAAILLTHLHPDHAGATAALATATGAPVRCGRGGLDTNLQSGVGATPMEDGEVVGTDAGVLQSVATPGHVPEHLCFLWPADAVSGGDALFVGDLLMGSGDTTLVAPPEGDLGEYLESLDRVREMGAAVLYPSHGPEIRRPEAVLERYRSHRIRRIEQVRAARRTRPGATVQELVEAIYGPDLDPALRAAAAGSIAAVIGYLERAGRN
jgi:glyoxylase-like metal-dependent hydrolase (beta-lactamase superfamily II)